jgi:tRNA_anti-like
MTLNRFLVVPTMGLSLLLGCGDNQNQKAREEEELAKEEEKQVQEQKPIELSGADLTREYYESIPKADEKYKGKVVQVSGFVDRVTDMKNAKIVFVEGSLSDFKGTSYLWTVGCAFSDSDQNAVASLANGKQVTIKGICIGGGGRYPGVDLRRCKLVR